MNWRFVLLFVVFLLSRFWILQHPPAEYSDIKHDYERYANQWRYGLTPYRKIMFEYPPASIPLIAFPLEMDQRGYGKYYQNYRVEIFVFEIALFSVLVYGVFSLPIPQERKWLAMGFYIFAGIWAKDYWYEGLDLLFFGIFAMMVVWILKVKQTTVVSRVITWMLFWLTVAIKIMTAPLIIPLLLMKKLPWKKELLVCAMGAILVWGVPAVLYRSSLSVFLVFHANRPMKYGAFGSYIVEVANSFTHTEHRLQEAPDFPMVGPVANVTTRIFKIIFPIAILGVLYYAYVSIHEEKSKKKKSAAEFEMLLRVSLMYIFAIFLTGKTFSSPFHIWYVPLLTLYPFRSTKTQIFAYLLALLMLGLDTTPFLTAPKQLQFFRDALRFIPMGILFVMFARKKVNE